MKTKRKHPDAAAKKRLALAKKFERIFERSKRGNLTVCVDGVWFTVFKRKSDGFFGWSICDGETNRYSRGYETEQEAFDALIVEYAR